MSCGGRVYKGDTVTISVPFEVDDYSNLTITYTTIGDEKIVKTQEEVEIEDGFITYTFEPGELDLLPDGVIYYTIECDVNGVPNVDSTNTNLYLKTPAGYSGRTAEDIYQEGYEAGLEDCSGSSCNLQTKSVVVTANTQTVSPDQGYDGMDNVSIDATSFGDGRYHQGYESGYDDGYEEAEEDYPSIQYQKNYTATTISAIITKDPGFDAMRQVKLDTTPVFNQGFESGYTAGQEDCSGGTSCNLQAKSQSIDGNGTGLWNIYPDAGYDGMERVTILDDGYGQAKYDEGYAEGLSSQCDLVPLGVVVHAGDSGVIDNITPDSAAGFSSVSVDARDYGAYLYTSGYNAGLYDCSATTCNLRPFDYQIYPSWDGYMSFSASQASLDGFSSVSIIDLGYGQRNYDEGYQSGYTDGFQSGYTSSPNRSKITFKVRNATVIQADLTFLSFSVNGVPVEDVGAIFQTEEIQNFNYTTLWISGYTQPSIITGVEITIKAENIYLNTFSYDWNLFTEINGAEYEAASRRQEFFDIVDDNNKSRRIIYTYTGTPLYNEYSFEAGKDYGIEIGRPISYKEGMDSVIKSVLDENDTDLVIAYYYTSAYTNCLITGEYLDIDGNECISAMSINGGVWQTEQKYLHLQSGWTQIRFKVLNGGYRAMFSHAFTPSEECYMDALKVVSIPSGHCPGANMFRNNEGIRVLSTSCGVLSCHGATNLNVVITHYTGSQRQFDYFPSSGVLFIPEGSTADWASILPNWAHIEMF